MPKVMNPSLKIVLKVWTDIASVLSVPGTEEQYQQRVALLNELLNEVGEDESHPWISLTDTLGVLIHAYELEHYAPPTASPVEVLHSLMADHHLDPCDLPELGKAAEVIEILKGERSLNLPQIQMLSQRFRVSPAVFIRVIESR